MLTVQRRLRYALTTIYSPALDPTASVRACVQLWNHFMPLPHRRPAAASTQLLQQLHAQGAPAAMPTIEP